jgi:tetratricopeptide (TPR) repeat protein
MKRQNGLVLPTAALLFLLVSCAAQFSFIAPAIFSEATELKAVCAQQKLDAATLKIADSLYDAGDVLIQKGKNEAAFTLLDRAIDYYRIALTNAAIAKKEKEVAAQEQALSKTRDDVSAYQQVLKELKTMEQR